MITLQQFASVIGCTQMTAAVWHEQFLAAMAERTIDTLQRIAAFLAQVGHESGSLGRCEENLNYSAQRLLQVWPNRFPTIESGHYYEHSPERLANLVYASRMGNGGYESGDGWRYHGRGPIQITGATNYRRCGAALHLPLIEQPELLLEPKHGARSAAWFFEDRGCIACADDCAAVTQLVNGGNTGLADRQARFDHALRVLA
jgi:putative chitinase